MSPSRLLLCAILAAALGACVVGPRYAGPPPMDESGQGAAGFRRGADPQALSTAQPAAAPWWRSLNDAQLTALIEQDLAANANVRLAQARVRAARAALSQARADLGPGGGATASALAVHPPQSGLGRLLSQGGGGGDTDIYVAGFDASWELDAFGGRRRAIEGEAARAQAAAADLADVRVELAADIARAYVDLRDCQQRIALARQAGLALDQVVALTLQRRAAGVASDAEVARAQSDAAQPAAQAATLSARIEADLDQLAVLVGREPGALDADLAPGPTPPAPPALTRIGDPAGLVRRRPDIRAAERRLAAGDADIGRAIAQLFPTVSLRGDLGFSASDPGAVFSGSSLLALGGPTLTWNILDYPRIHARIRQARALREADLADYQRTVLAALRDAEDCLSRYAHQRQVVAADQTEADLAARLARIDAERRRAGTLSAIDAAAAHLRDLQAQAALTSARAALTTDYIALQKSLGLGWE